MKNQFLEAGQIVNTHGIKGEVKIMPWADSPEFLCAFDTLYMDGKPVKLLAARPHKTMVLAALEVDVDFNVNVITGSDGILRGAPGGHPDTANGAKCTIIVAPLVRGRIPTVCDKVVTISTPGESIDILVTEYGVAVNPKRADLIAALDEAGVEHVTIQQLRDKAYSMVGVPDPVQFKDRVVAIMEARDGTILDVVREIKPYSYDG